MLKYKRLVSFITSFAIFLVIYFGFTEYQNYYYKPIFQKYLSERYPNKLAVEGIYNNLLNGEYCAYACSKDNPNISFYVYAKKDATGSYVFNDDYFIFYWKNKVESELKQYASTFYNVHDVVFELTRKSSNTDELYTSPEGFYKSYNPMSQIPDYDKVKSNGFSNFYRTIDIEINGEINNSNHDSEYKKMYEVVKFLKVKSYKADSISISYGKGGKTANGSSFTADSDSMFFFDQESLDKINSLDDLKKSNP